MKVRIYVRRWLGLAVNLGSPWFGCCYCFVIVMIPYMQANVGSVRIRVVLSRILRDMYHQCTWAALETILKLVPL